MQNGGRFSKIDFDEAPQAALSAADPWPNLDANGCIQAADAMYDQGEYDAALTMYSRALRFNRDLKEPWVGQVRCLISLSEFPEAITWSNRALERFPKSPDLLACKGLALALSGSIVVGIEYLDGASQMRSPSSWVWLARGQCLLRTTEGVQHAQRCFLKAVELSDNQPSTELRVGMAYIGAGMYAEARPLLVKAARLAEKNPLAQYEAGVAHEELGEFVTAAGYYERAMALRKNYRVAREALARVRHPNPINRWLKQLTARIKRK